MNIFKVFGLMLLISGIFSFFFVYEPDLDGGPISILLHLWVPILLLIAGIGLFVKGLLWKAPVKKKSASARGKKKKKR